MLTEHVAEYVCASPDNVQDALGVNETVPFGGLAVPGDVSVTVAEHVTDSPTVTAVGTHETEVDVVLRLIVIRDTVEFSA